MGRVMVTLDKVMVNAEHSEKVNSRRHAPIVTGYG
jgi:hypothetical protein